MNRKTVIKTLLAMLVSMAISARASIWEFIKPLPVWWKILIALVVGLLVTGAFIFGCSMESYFFELIGMNPL